MNVKKLSVILLLICFCLQQLPALSCIQRYKYKLPKNYDSSKEKIDESDILYYNTRFTEILPNPVIYLYGKNTYNDPILLMVFSSTIPEEWLNGQKSSDLDSVFLKLKIPWQHGYYYKVLKISADQILQTVAYSTSSTLQSSLEGQGQFAPAGGGGSGSLKGRIEHTFNKSKAYDTIRPIITYSGVGSDTVTIMLKRGEEYPIPNGRINVYMMVRAIRDESNKIGEIINKHYNSENDNDFYRNDERFKNELGCLVNEISCNTYKDLYDFLGKRGVNLDKVKGFQYKKVNEFIKTSVILKYKDRCELLDALLEAESKDKQILDSIEKLTSHSSRPGNFLKEVDKENYVDVSYKLSKNVVDFINSIPAQYNPHQLNNAENFKKLVFANRSQIKLMNNANASSNNVLINNVVPSSDSNKSSADSNACSGPSTDSDKSSKDTSADNFNIASNDLYAEAYKLKMRISAYNYAICKICCPSPDFDISKYIINDDSNVCKCQNELEKYQGITALNKSIYINADTNASVFNFELQEKARKLLDDMFDKKNKEKSNEKAILDFVKIDNLILAASCGSIKSWKELKENPYYSQKYASAIALVDEIIRNSQEERQKEITCDQSLIELVTNNNNVDLRFEKTIVQYEKNSFFRFEKKYIDLWCPPIISRVAIFPIGSILWPLHLPDKRLRYEPGAGAITTSKILEGSAFDKEHNNEDGYIRDDDCIFNDMKGQIKQIKEERGATIVIPTITQPATGK